MTRNASIALLAAAASFASAQPTVTFEQLPQGCSSAVDISTDGRWIVGGYDPTGVGYTHGSYLFDRQTGTLEILADASSPDLFISASAVSDDGNTVFGNMPDLGSGLPEKVYAGIWQRGVGWNSIGALPNALTCPSRSSAYEMSTDGSTAVGLSWDGCSGRAFSWSTGTGMVQLEHVGAASNRATVVSNDGSIIAGFASETGARIPAYWDANGDGFMLNSTSQNEGEVKGISDDGSVMLCTYYDYANPSKDGWYDAYKWTMANGFEIIGNGSLIGGWAGNPMDISTQTGTIIGFDNMMGNRRAWIQYEGTGACQELVGWVEAHGGVIPVGSIELNVANAISADGSTIVGFTAGERPWIINIDLGCEVDFNNDGFVDSGDISVFVSMFLAQDLAADMNSDGFLDSGDITAFVAAFIAGC